MWNHMGRVSRKSHGSGFAGVRVPDLAPVRVLAAAGTLVAAVALYTYLDIDLSVFKRVASDNLEVPIAHAYPLAELRVAFRQLESGHNQGKSS
jgi:hypothetical protein